jgi:hypothetical protein
MASKSTDELLELIHQELFSMNNRLAAIETEVSSISSVRDAVGGLASEVSGFTVALGEFHHDVAHQKDQIDEQFERNREAHGTFRAQLTAIRNRCEGFAKDLAGVTADVSGIKLTLAANEGAAG